MDIIKAINLKKYYTSDTYEVRALDGVSLTVEDGEFIAVVGTSGCGKTTLLNLILGITEADSGKIWFNGEDITNLAMEKRGFNIVFQDYALFPNLNVYKNIVYGLKKQTGGSPRRKKWKN